MQNEDIHTASTIGQNTFNEEKWNKPFHAIKLLTSFYLLDKFKGQKIEADTLNKLRDAAKEFIKLHINRSDDLVIDVSVEGNSIDVLIGVDPNNEYGHFYVMPSIWKLNRNF